MQLANPSNQSTVVVLGATEGQHASLHGWVDPPFSRSNAARWDGAQRYQRAQEVSSLSSIENIAPASTLTPRTTQVRPLTSTSFAS
jgi:hypothetical protein